MELLILVPADTKPHKFSFPFTAFRSTRRSFPVVRVNLAENSADRLDPELCVMTVDVIKDYRCGRSSSAMLLCQAPMSSRYRGGVEVSWVLSGVEVCLEAFEYFVGDMSSQCPDR